MVTEITIRDSDEYPPGFVEMLKGCFTEKPDKKALAEMQRFADTAPELVSRFFNLASYARSALFEKLIEGKAGRITLEANVMHLQNELGYTQAPMLEKMLIDNIVNTWLRYQWVEYQIAGLMGKDGVSLAVIQHWEKRLTESQKRHLRAVEALAKVRKMGLPVLQVNIASEGGQQVNIAGDLVRPGGSKNGHEQNLS